MLHLESSARTPLFRKIVLHDETACTSAHNEPYFTVSVLDAALWGRQPLGIGVTSVMLVILYPQLR